MSLLRMIKNRATRAVANAVGDVIEDAVSDVLDKAVDTAKNKKGFVPKASDTNRKESGEKLLRQRIENIVSSQWEGYELKKNVSPEELFAEDGARTYSYGIYQDGQPKAMIMVLTNRNHYKSKGVELARQACKSQGVAYMNFMTHLPNTEDYISQRLCENIR